MTLMLQDIHAEVLLQANCDIRSFGSGVLGKSSGAADITTKPPSTRPLTDELRKGLEALSKGQADCLRLAGQGMLSKEIAEELTMSAGRVDKQILAARQKLGGLSRRDAGRLFLAWEEALSPAPEGGYSMGAQSMGLSPMVHFTPSAAVDHDADAPKPAFEALAERQEPYLPSPALPDRFELVPLRSSGRLSNDLSSTTVLATIAKLMLGALFAVGSALALLSSLTQLTRH